MSKSEFLTQAEILRRFPFGAHAWKKGVEAGRFPSPIVFGPRVKRWKAADIERLLSDLMATGN